MNTERQSLEISHFAVAIGAFGLGAVMAVMQALSRADIDVVFRSPKVYYLSVTAHGVLMALVFTTFFIMGLGLFVARTSIGGVASERWAWAGFWVALVGTLITTVAILSGTSSVLYTFYPPLLAHPAFYIGAALLVVGSWIWSAVVLVSWRRWRAAHSEPLPLAMHGMVTCVIIWLLATSGLAAEVLGQLIPWSLGWVDTIDPILARTFFWWFGHPLTYFWLVPAYVLWYTVLPQVAGGRLFSDRLTRVVFVMFILFSTPVGLHHQFTDPGIDPMWKLVHTVTTYAILFPSLVTAFTVVASLEIGGRLRGGAGVFGWIRHLPWKDPFLLSVVFAMLSFTIGGFGGAINAAYAMNSMVHNTFWIPAHFHVTVGSAVALTFLGASYWLFPRVVGREIVWPWMARLQAVTWFVGMMIFSISGHITGLMGQPRRVYTSNYFGAEQAGAWQWLTTLSAVGGVVLFVSSGLFITVMIASWLNGASVKQSKPLYARALDPLPERAGLYDRFPLWVAIAILLIVAAYAFPLVELLTMERFGSPGFRPF